MKNILKKISLIVLLIVCGLEPQIFSAVIPASNSGMHVFSTTFSKYFTEKELSALPGKNPEVEWRLPETKPFSELIVSWNAFRPTAGYIAIWVSVKYANQWSAWHKLAHWGKQTQKTFLNKRSLYVHTKHCRVEMQRTMLARGFRVKVVFHDGAQPKNLKALFACASRLSQFKIIQPKVSLPSVSVSGIPRQSQMRLDHERYRDLCSPVSTSMLVAYFYQKILGEKLLHSMHDFAIEFAQKSHDQGYLNIYGNWILNVAQAFDSSNGAAFFRVERLNSFYDLHYHLSKKNPVAVSVRRLTGGATPYANGHIMLVVGWNRPKRRVLCIDPAFGNNKATLKAYRITDFLAAWGRSNNLAYVPIPAKL